MAAFADNVIEDGDLAAGEGEEEVPEGEPGADDEDRCEEPGVPGSHPVGRDAVHDDDGETGEEEQHEAEDEVAAAVGGGDAEGEAGKAGFHPARC